MSRVGTLCRMLVHAGTGASLVLFIVVVGFGVRSYAVWEVLNSHGFDLYKRWCGPTWQINLFSGNGGIRVMLSRPAEPIPEAERQRLSRIRVSAYERYRGPLKYPGIGPGGRFSPLLVRWGFNWRRLSSRSDFAGYADDWIVFPYWFRASWWAILPGFVGLRAVWKRNRARRSTRPGCIVCGYDLRATPHRCPECGSAAVTEQRKAAEPGEEKRRIQEGKGAENGKRERSLIEGAEPQKP